LDIPLRITFRKACPVCATRADEKAARACTTCEGEGRVVREQHTYKVRIPAGIRDGQEVRIRELGGLGKHGGAAGDLYVTVHVADRSAARYSARSDGFVPFVSNWPPTSLRRGYTRRLGWRAAVLAW